MVWVERTDLIQLHDVKVRAELAQRVLGGPAVRAVGFGEDDCVKENQELLACLLQDEISATSSRQV